MSVGPSSDPAQSQLSPSSVPAMFIFALLDLLADCGLLADQAQAVVDHLPAVYPRGRDLPLDLLRLANRLLWEVGGDQTYELVMRLATTGVLGRGMLDQQ